MKRAEGVGRGRRLRTGTDICGEVSGSLDASLPFPSLPCPCLPPPPPPPCLASSSFFLHCFLCPLSAVRPSVPDDRHLVSAIMTACLLSLSGPVVLRERGEHCNCRHTDGCNANTSRIITNACGYVGTQLNPRRSSRTYSGTAPRGADPLHFDR